MCSVRVWLWTWFLCGAIAGDMRTAVAELPYQQVENVVFAEVHGTGLLMDVFSPTGPKNGLAIVDVASGAWHSDRGKIRDHTLAQLYSIFCARGYVVFAVRPGSLTRYTALDMDGNLKTAIQYVKEHAEEYQIDGDRLGLTGASAGGHLATLAALTPTISQPNAKDKLKRHNSHVAAVAVFFPPTDFVNWQDGKRIDLKILAPLLSPGATTENLGGLLGKSDDEIRAMAEAISPLHRVSEPTTPFLLIHGDADPVVPLAHSEKFVAAVKAAGGSAELIVKRGGAHPWATIPIEVGVMADWFDKQLKP